MIDLLEKSRAVGQANDERIFHFFYQMLNGCTSEEKSQFLCIVIVCSVIFVKV